MGRNIFELFSSGILIWKKLSLTIESVHFQNFAKKNFLNKFAYLDNFFDNFAQKYSIGTILQRR